VLSNYSITDLAREVVGNKRHFSPVYDSIQEEKIEKSFEKSEVLVFVPISDLNPHSIDTLFYECMLDESNEQVLSKCCDELITVQ
jgi:hypothetical protein